MSNLIEKITKKQIRNDIPEFRVGDTVKVNVRIVEGNKSRIQAYEGIVIARKSGGVSETFTVRKISAGVGVERTFPVHSPKLESIEVIKKGKVRRAKLNYLRNVVGNYKIKEKRTKVRVSLSFRMLMNKYVKEIISLIVIVILVLLFKRYIMMPVKVNGDSMRETLKNNDVLILNRLSRKINRFDVVVVDTDDSYIIKRVIGLPNEELKILDNKVYINGEYLDEHHIMENSNMKNYSINIPSDHYFVMGDNRDISLDSRLIGTIPRKDIMGKVNLIIFPFNRIGKGLK